MTYNWLSRLGAACVLLIGIGMLPQPSYAAVTGLEVFQEIGTNNSCGSNGVGFEPSVRTEGQTEQSADVVVEAEAAGNLVAGHFITVTFTKNVDLTSPVVANGGTLPTANVVVCDTGGTPLAIDAPVVNRAIVPGGFQLSITFQVMTANANATSEAEVVFRNLFWDVTPLAIFTDFQVVRATDCPTSTACGTTFALDNFGDNEFVEGGLGFPQNTGAVDIGFTENTIASSFVCDFTDYLAGVAGTETGTTICANGLGGGEDFGFGFGLQNAGGPLIDQTALGFQENTDFLTFNGVPALTDSTVAPSATQVEFNVWNVPVGVTVSFPPLFQVDPLDGAITLGNSRSGPNGSCSATGTGAGPAIDCIYDVTAQATDPDDEAFAISNGTQISTAGTAGANNIVVTIGATSGEGLADILATFGPDCTSGAVPRFTGFPVKFFTINGVLEPLGYGLSTGTNNCTKNKKSSGCTVGGISGQDCEGPGGKNQRGRGILVDEFFNVEATLTSIVVPWVTDSPVGWNTGIAVSNTSLDNFGCPNGAIGCAPNSANSLAVGTTGPIAVTIFPQGGGTPIVCNTSTGKAPDPAAALNSTGALAPGRTWSVDLVSLLASSACTPSTNSPVQGYMLIQTGYLEAHAAVFDFTPSFGFADTPVIVLPSSFFRRENSNNAEKQGFVRRKR